LSNRLSYALLVDAKKETQIKTKKINIMNATSKAIELVKKYKGFEMPNEHIASKQCALICVDEILNDNPNIYDSDRLNWKYWNQVKIEINKL